MLTTQFWKGLAMVIIGILVSSFSVTPFDLQTTVITLIGSILVYIGINAFPALRPVSIPSTITFRDAVAALLILIGNGIVQSVTMIVTEGKIDWAVMGKIVAGITLTYLTTTFFSGPYSAKKVDWSHKARVAYNNAV